MRKAISILFLFIFLSTSSSFGQLLRIPVLCHHYYEHVQWDNNNSIRDFLANHYSPEINHPDDQHNDHQNLPFKSTDGSFSQNISFIPSHIISTIKRVEDVAAKNPIILSQPGYCNAYLQSIWQPPRFC